MIIKKKEFFLLIFLILLQSCSGGRIGNFLKSSFNDLEKISQDKDSQENLKNKTTVLQKDEEINLKNYEKRNNLEKSKSLENKKEINLDKIQKQKYDKISNSGKKRKIELQSYKIILILKEVDPKDPTEEFSTILRNSDVNFEIEKIERFLESKNKSMNKN
ncbi:hypothetical protein [uncultured Prochlorococcus sp.]|uniref:hypothetical protein n=1 Tax=uncultured Prochlorococcus sp. TaxID=159733 RepID=UPI00258E641A|nr:hypothetical protein [uncultured Prochlorococcus sp.]